MYCKSLKKLLNYCYNFITISVLKREERRSWKYLSGLKLKRLISLRISILQECIYTYCKRLYIPVLANQALTDIVRRIAGRGQVHLSAHLLGETKVCQLQRRSLTGVSEQQIFRLNDNDQNTTTSKIPTAMQ